MKDFSQFIPEEAIRAKPQFFTVDEVRARGQAKIFELQLKAALGQLSDDDARDYAQIPQNLNEDESPHYWFCKCGNRMGGVRTPMKIHEQRGYIINATFSSPVCKNCIRSIKPRPSVWELAKSTPYDVSIENLNEKMQVTPLLLKELEKHLDKLFASIKIDVEFSNHFKQRLVDRASTLDANEVMKTFEKLLAQHKGRIKNQMNFKAVLKDISNNNNIPFAIDYDFDKDEFILTAVTVMNKKNFKTGDQRVLKVK